MPTTMPVPTAARRAKRVIDSETPSPSAEEVEVEDDDELDEDDDREGDEDEDEDDDGDEDDELDELDDESDDPLAGSLSEGSEFDATPEPSSVKIKLRVGGAASAARGGRASRTASRGGRAAAAASTATLPSARPTRAAAAPAARRGRAAAAPPAAPAPAASTSTRAAAAASTSTSVAAGKRKREPTADDEDEDDLEEEEGAEQGDEDVDEDDEFAAGGEDGALSPSKMTARQRAKQNKDLQDTLIALPDGLPKIKPMLTEAERLQKREEMARRRKRQNEQRLQDEQDQTINRLLRAQTGRSRSKLDQASPMPDDSSAAGAAGAAAAANGSGLPSGMSSPVRRAPRLAEGVHYRSALEGDAVVLSVSVPKGREAWIALGAEVEVEERMVVDGAKVVAVREVAECAVAGCGEKRKYRCVKAFEVGGCSLAHLKEVEKGLEVKA